MAHTVKPFYLGLKKIFNKEIDLDTDVLKVILVSNGWTPNYVTDEFVDDGGANDVIDEEINAGNGDTNGYFPGHGGDGRQTLGSVSVTVSASGLTIDAADVTFAGLEAALEDVTYIVIAAEGTSDDSDAALLFCVELDPVFDPDGGDLLCQWNSSGIYRIAHAA